MLGPNNLKPFTKGIGTEITGIDLSEPLDDKDFSFISKAFEAHRLLLFKKQTLNAAEQVRFSERFGPLEDFPDPKDRADGFKTVLRVTNIDKKTDNLKPVDDPGHRSFTLGTSSWHIDSSFRQFPSLASALYAIEIPGAGGETMFADTVLAFKSLSNEIKQKIVNLKVIHDFEETRRRHGLPPRPPEVRAATPPATHPLVVERPNGVKSLFIGSHASGIEKMSQKDAKKLLDELESLCTKEEYTYTHNWEPGDLLFFDNISVLHQAKSYDLTGSRRLLHRTTVAGTSPL